MGNINIQNANNAANNENKATAGRRRTLKRLERLKNLLKGNQNNDPQNSDEKAPPDIRVGFKPIKIKYHDRKRRESDIDVVAEESSLTALTYIDLFLQLQNIQDKPKCSQRLICCTAKSMNKLGELAKKISGALAQKMVLMLDLDNDHIQAHFRGQNGQDCSQIYVECRVPQHNCL